MMDSFLNKSKNGISGFNSRKPKTSYYLMYSIAFAVLACLVFSFFVTSQKSFVWVGAPDGLSQHFNSLAYYGSYLREIFTNFFQGNSTVPMWDFSIGYGADIMTTLHYYAIGDPLNLLSVFFKPEQTEFLYCALVVVRLYLSGIAFSLFCRKMKRSGYGVFLGAITYAFCGFALYASVRHPYFINSMIYLPLLLLGVEKIFKKERPYLFVGMVLISTVSNFYFFYVLSVLVVFYIAFRFFMLYKENIVKNLAINFSKFAGFYLVGFAMGCLIFIPVAMLTLSSNRTGATTALHPLYEISFYTQFVAAFVGGKWNSNWTCLSFAPIALSCVVLLFSEKKRNTHLKVMFVILTFAAFLPLAGKVLNGFSYVTNRWMFAYALLVSFIIATVAPSIEKLTTKKVCILASFTLAYLAFVVFVPSGSKASFAVLLVMTVVIVLSFFLQEKFQKIKKKKVVVVTKVVLVGLTMLGIVINANSRYSESKGNYTDEFVNFKNSYSLLTDTESMAIKDLDNSQFFRYEIDTQNSDRKYNSAVQNKTFGTDYYFSLVDSNVSNYMQSMRFVRNNDATYSGFDGRAYLSTLATSKYFVSESEDLLFRPFGYVEKVLEKYSETNKKNYHVFENENALPFGFTYSSYIAQSAFDKLTATEKQQAVLQGAVGDFAKSVEKTLLDFTDKEIEYTIENNSNDVEVKENEIVVSKKKAEITLNFTSMENSETYLIFDNLVFDDNGKLGDYGSIRATESGVEHNIRVNTPEYSWYTGNHDFLTNLGYSKDCKTSVKLVFNQKGTFSFDAMRIASQPMGNLKSQSDKLKENILQDVSFGTNTVTGKIQLDTPKVLFLSVPFDDGWSIFVDGEKAELKQCSIMFSGVELSSGKHSIELKYKTPFKDLGMVVSMLGLLSAIGIVVCTELKRKNKSQ